MLYKYVPGKHVDAVMAGDLLFRNLAFFRRVEDGARGDVAEGMHIDRPDNVVTIKDAETGIAKSAGNFRFHNEIDQEKVFAFCLSTALDPRLFREFGCDAVVEITDVQYFLLRTASAINKSPMFAKSGLIAGEVEYYRSNRAAVGNVKNPEDLPFFKPIQFSRQREYRLVCAQRGGLVLRQSIVRGNHFLAAEAAEMQQRERHFRVGSLPVSLVRGALGSRERLFS